MKNDPVIIALDFESANEADHLVASGTAANVYKVGMELYAAAGTVKRSVAARCGAAFLTIHGAVQVMRAAIEGRGFPDETGIVGSPLEACAIRAEAGPAAILVTPGVRSRGAAAGDQKRVAMLAEGVRNGADYVVIGRQVTRSADPAAALAAIYTELQGES